MGIERYKNYLVGIIDSKAEPVYQLNPKMITDIKSEISIIKRIEETVYYYPQMIRTNICDYFNLKNAEEKYFNDTKEITKAFYNSTDIMIDLNRSLLNILTSFRGYIDNVGHMLSSQFGKNSNIKEYFEKAQNIRFDSDFSYRFMSKYRNYVQHCGLPISEIITDNGLYSSVGIYKSDVVVKIEKLLEYDGWGIVKKDLLGMNDHVSINTIIRDFEKSISQLHIALVDYIHENKLYNYEKIYRHYIFTKEKYPNSSPAIIVKDNNGYHFVIFPEKYLENEKKYREGK